METNIKNLGTLQGPLLVFGGIYSNFQALEKFYAIAQELQVPPSNIIFTGDVVAYCASPSQCIDFVQNWGIHHIQGNVEENLINGTDECGCNFEKDSRCDLLAKAWFPHVKNSMTAQNLAYLSTLPEQISFQYAGQEAAVIHGSSNYISEFIFASTPWHIKQQNFEKLKVELILAGHCGIPFLHQHQELTWLNAGAIGMPANDGTSRTWFTLLTDNRDDLKIQFCSMEYDSFEANQLMLERDLPRTYAETITSGLWDNNDILPELETSLAGTPLAFEGLREFGF